MTQQNVNMKVKKNQQNVTRGECGGNPAPYELEPRMKMGKYVRMVDVDFVKEIQTLKKRFVSIARDEGNKIPFPEYLDLTQLTIRELAGRAAVYLTEIENRVRGFVPEPNQREKRE